MKWGFAVLLVLTVSSLVQAQELRICVVDAESGKPVAGATIKRWASQWQPRILRPPGKFWFPEKEVAADADGRVAINKVAGDDWYAVRAEGYEDGNIEKARSKYQLAARSGGKAQELVQKSGVVIVPLKRNNPKSK